MLTRSCGASSSTLMSRIPMRLIWRVLGIGVAESVRTSTFSRSFLIFSLCVTPKRCSSSTTRSPSRLNFTSLDKIRCVPITISTRPDSSPSLVFFCSAAVRKRDIISTQTGYSFIRSVKVLKCCCARIVVGTRTATCSPSCTALNAARIAISVLP